MGGKCLDSSELPVLLGVGGVSKKAGLVCPFHLLALTQGWKMHKAKMHKKSSYVTI